MYDSLPISLEYEVPYLISDVPSLFLEETGYLS